MAAAHADDSRAANVWPRIALGVAALILVGTAALFAASWIDSRTYDITCGSVTRPRMWFGNHSCQRVMTFRGAVSAVLVVGGVAFGCVALLRRRVTAGFATKVLIAVIVTCAVILVINEAVRSGGGFWYL